jgi:arsenate reductase
MTEKLLFICYPKCTTCQKAKRWLDDKGLVYEIRNIKEQNPTITELAAWQKKSNVPVQKFFNTSGLVYKSLALKDKLAAMPAAEQLSLLATDGMLVKRPLLITADKVLVGFKPAEWEALLGEEASV